MKTLRLMCPGVINRDTVHDMLLLAGSNVVPGEIQKWTEFELHIAYDWAAREYLTASDNPVRRRDKPSFVSAAEQSAALHLHLYHRRSGDGEVFALFRNREDAEKAGESDPVLSSPPDRVYGSEVVTLPILETPAGPSNGGARLKPGQLHGFLPEATGI